MEFYIHYVYMPAKAWSTLVEGDLKIKRTSTNGSGLAQYLHAVPTH